MKTKSTTPKSRVGNQPTLYAAIDLHSRTSVLGVMNEAGEMLSNTRFATSRDNLRSHLGGLPEGHRVELTMEAAPMARWARSQVIDLVERVVVCNPRYNRLVSYAMNKGDEVDTRSMCELLRLGSLREVWVCDEEARQIFHDLVYDLLKLRDQQRQLKTLIKTRYRAYGVLQLHGKEIFHPVKRERWLAELPAHRRSSLEQLYGLLDTTLKAWRGQLSEVNRAGKAFPEIARFQQVPGIGDVGAAVFSAIIQDPHRFQTGKQICTYSALGITSRSSDNKPLGYERINPHGQHELKNLSYHAWRTGIRVGQQSDVVRRFYDASVQRTGSKRHARLNTQRKILITLWSMWKHDTEFDPAHFLQTPEPGPTVEPKARRRRRRRRKAKST